MKNVISLILLTLLFTTPGMTQTQDVTVKPSLVFDKTTGNLSVDLTPYATVVTTNVISSQLKTAQQDILTLQAASGGVVKAHITIPATQATYTIPFSANGQTIYVYSKCTITVPSLSADFYCKIINVSGSVTFVPTGVTMASTGSLKRLVAYSKQVELNYETATKCTLIGSLSQ